MVGGRESTESTQPSQFDAEKWETAKQLFNVLMPKMVPELAGTASAAKSKTMGQNFSAKTTAASGSKVAPGSPTLMTPPSGGGANSNMVNYAMQLYGVKPNLPQSGSATSKPGGADYANSLANLYLIYNAMKSGGSGSDYGSIGGSALGTAGDK